MYSLFEELKRGWFFYTNQSDKVTDDSFKIIIENSNLKDTSQINFFYLFSLFTPFILNICNIYILYFICCAVNIIILIRIYFIDKNEKFRDYDIESFSLNVIAPFVSLYIFTGFIASTPFLILKSFKELKNKAPWFTWLINLVNVLAVIIKIVCIENLMFTDNLILNHLFLYIIGISITFIIFIIFYIISCCCCEEYLKKEEKNLIDYKFGKIYISSEYFEIAIKTKTCYHFCCSMLNRKLIFLLIVNFCSRASKLKFKNEYNNNFIDESENNSIWYIIINFACSFLIFIIYSLIFNCLYKNSEENSFSFFIIIENTLLFFFSLIGFYPNLEDKYIKWISFKSIFIGGSVNFIFSDYYSSQYINYLSISGIVSISQVIFRLIEMLIKFKDKKWYYLQIGSSIFAILYTLCYTTWIELFCKIKCCKVNCCKCCEWFEDCECCDCCECETCCENNCQCWYNYYKFVKCFNLFNCLIICCVSLTKCILFSVICFIYFLYKKFLKCCCKKEYEDYYKARNYQCCECCKCCKCCECCESCECCECCKCCECCECYEYCDDCQCCECYKCIDCCCIDCLIFISLIDCCECYEYCEDCKCCKCCIECCKNYLLSICNKCCCRDNKNIKRNNSEIPLSLIKNEID